MFLTALMSLSEVPTLPGVPMSLSATNCRFVGTISFIPLRARIMSLSSLKLAISINEFSKEVSFKSAAVLNSLLNVPPLDRGWSVAQSSYPSPPVKLELKALFRIAAALTCLVCAILLANALVYLAPSLSYKLSSIASSVRANANATVS